MIDTKSEMTNKIYREMFADRLTYQRGWNYERRQTDKCLFTLAPVLGRIYKDTPVEAKGHAIKRHFEFLSIYATLAPLFFGLIAAFRVNTPEDKKDSTTSIETGLTGPIAGSDDELFWLALRPVCASIRAAIAVIDNIFGAMLTFVVFNILNQGVRRLGFRIGYTKGMETINSGSDDKVIKRMSDAVTISGLCVVGCLVSTTVKINVPLVFASDERKIVVQELIGKIMPCFLPVLVAVLCYWRFKETNGKEVILLIFGIMIVSVGLTYLGTLGQNLQETSARYDHDVVPLRLRNILKRRFINEPQVWTTK